MHNSRRAILLSLTLLLPVLAIAQSRDDSNVPRFEAGFGLVAIHLNHTGMNTAGLSGRFHYNFNDHLALDAEVFGLPGPNPKDFSSNTGGTTGLFGVRTGFRTGNDFSERGLFLRARTGFVHVGPNVGEPAVVGTHPALDIGPTFELYPHRNAAFRLDLGDVIIPYGNAIIFRSDSSGRLIPLRLGTQHNFLLGFGFAIRF
jgi:hypothetical protein